MRTCERGKGRNRRTTEKHRNEEDWKVQAKESTWRQIKKLSTISLKVQLKKGTTNLAHLLKQTCQY